MPPKNPPFYPVPGENLTHLDQQDAHSTGLDQEIDLLRYFIRRVALQQDQAADLIEAAFVLRTVSLSLFTLTGLIRTNYNLQAAGEPAVDEFENTLAELARDWEAAKKSPGYQDYSLFPPSSPPA